jgi:GH24 family phage-related lysozyme (muramidase)
VKLKWWHIAGGVAAVLLGVTVFSLRSKIISILSTFVPSVEGFRSSPYWDVKRWSWGYGTAAPGSSGAITRDQAFADMLSYLMGDYEELQKRITRQLRASQWAAFLSFAYNTGLGNAYNLVSEINAGNDSILEREWKRYVYSDGEINPDLVNRRLKEWELWKS